MNRVKVEGRADLVRDMNSGAVISINSTEAENARQRMYRQQLEEQEQRELKSDVDQLKNDISVIKDLLTKLAEK
jgi:hypothetical protein